MWYCVVVHILLKEYFQRRFQIWSQKKKKKSVTLAGLVKQLLILGYSYSELAPYWCGQDIIKFDCIYHRRHQKEFMNFRATSSGLVVHYFNLITKINNGCKGEIQESFSLNINKSILAYINSGPYRQSSLQKYREWATGWIKSSAGLTELQDFIQSGI